jgi:hypothetical protein
MAPQAKIPVVAEDALKDLFFQRFKGCAIKLHRGKDAGGVEPRLKAGVDAVEV